MNMNAKKVLSTFSPYSIEKEIINIKLDANENPYDLFEKLNSEFIREVVNLNLNRYPDTDSDELRVKIAEHISVKKENIICGNGSDEIIQMLINAFVDKGEYVITHRPTFTMYNISVNIAGGNILEIPCDKDFNIPESEIIRESNERGAKLIFLCNPNNPTGTIIPKGVIKRIIQNTEAIVVVDEAYCEFSGETVVDWIYEYDRLIVLRTLSKAFALAGARIGYGVAGSPIMDILYKIKPPYNLNQFSQLIGKIYLENLSLIVESVESIKVEKKYLLERLSKLEGIDVFPTGGNFVLIRSPYSKKILELCKIKGIALRSFPNEILLKDCIRITVGNPNENDEVLNIIQKVVQ